MRTFGETQDGGRKDQDFIDANKDSPILVLNTRSYLNTLNVLSGLTLLRVERTGWLYDFIFFFSLSQALCLAIFWEEWTDDKVKLSNGNWNEGFKCPKSEDVWIFLIRQDMYKNPSIYHFQRYHSLSELPLIVVPLCHCQLYCLTLGPLQALGDTWSTKQELVLIMYYWSIQAGKKEIVEGFCKDPHVSNSAGFWDSFCLPLLWVFFFVLSSLSTRLGPQPSVLSVQVECGFYRTVMWTSQ